MKVLALGFFDRGNFGDELYKSVYADRLSARDIEFTCMSLEEMKQEPHVPVCYDGVCVGGGDILNTYFMRLLAPKLESFKGTKIALSVGVPFESCMHYVDLFDYVILRARVDEVTVKKRIGEEHVACFPDMVYTLGVPRTIGLPFVVSPRRIGIFLSRPIFAGGQNRHYRKVVKAIARNLDDVCRAYPGAVLYLIPFNTFESQDENDTILNAEVSALCRASERIKVVQEENWNLRAYQRWFGAIDAAERLSRYRLSADAATVRCPGKEVAAKSSPSHFWGSSTVGSSENGDGVESDRGAGMALGTVTDRGSVFAVG
ncbi:hypothetical protein CVIRNUC_003405 [Coccomyxa viridis]|uniref:Polysaccharide pyruvyl transferase domain-containing protein n=1 Tax=Coccomyxa viridis TaxID=1274662 RepID=A0AAV1I2A6_9CHLO|nr:hypothetical protein CVIRNUC_003405 [Coccomyxa viridis]